MLRILLLTTVIASVVLVVPVRAEKPNMSAAELQKTATHVVTGQVTAIYQQTEAEDNYEYTRYVAEIRVSECEKGDGLKPADLVYVRYWHRRWTGSNRPPPATSGHRGLPAKNELIRVYLARNAYDGFFDDNKDGGYNVVKAKWLREIEAGFGQAGCETLFQRDSSRTIRQLDAQSTAAHSIDVSIRACRSAGKLP